MENLLSDLRELGYNLVRVENKAAFYVFDCSGDRCFYVSSIFFRCALRHGYSYAVSYEACTSYIFVRFKLL